MKTVIIIPSRYASSRFPAKSLAPLRGAGGVAKTLIQRAWEAAQAVSGVDAIYVATDDERIRAAAEGFGAEVVMTPVACVNGTERCAAAIEALQIAPEIVVNLQGDAPLTPPWFVEALIAAMRGAPQTAVATPALRCDGAALRAFLADRRAGRVGGTTVVFDHARRALYFSKEVVPFVAPEAVAGFADDAPTPVFHHAGLYAYRPDALKRYGAFAVGALEDLEGLEQLRFLENGIPIAMVEVDARGRVFWELNNPEDTPKIEAALAEIGLD